MGAKVKVKATAVGTRVGRTGDVIHCNPEGSDELARFPVIDADDIPVLLEEPALIENPGDKLETVVPAGAPVFDLTRNDEAAASGVARLAGVDSAVGPETSGLSTRGATHYDPAQGVNGGATGTANGSQAAGDGGLDEDDPDAPPAPKRGRPSNADKAAAASKGSGGKAAGAKSGGAKSGAKAPAKAAAKPADKPKEGGDADQGGAGSGTGGDAGGEGTGGGEGGGAGAGGDGSGDGGGSE